MQDTIEQFTQKHKPVLPVIKIDEPEDIVPLAQALERGGITALEITLRSDAAMAAIEIAKQEFPNFCISAGTVTNAKQIQALAKLRVDFIVTPGITKSLLEATQANYMHILPGVSGPSDVMLGMEFGLHYFKLFPASVVGGVDMIKALGGPFHDCQFCPTGGLTSDNFMDYYQLPNVFAFGGSWMVANDLIQAQNWQKVEELSKALVDQLN